MKNFTQTLVALTALLLSAHAYAEEKNVTPDAPTSNHRLLLNLNLGVQDSTGDNKGMMPDFGARVGLDVGSVGNFARLVPTLSYSYGSLEFFFITNTVKSYDLQLNFRQLGGTGFYLGPQAGVVQLGSSSSFLSRYMDASFTQTFMSYGVFAGYEFFKDSAVSISPEVQLNHFQATTTYKVLLGLNINLF